MAANKFATMLHRNTHKITVILIYAVLEWILIVLLLLNSLFSYLIFKFSDYFGLKQPCLWCSRVDHIFDPSKGKYSYRDLLCENHAAEISKLGYCSNHRKLAESQYMCEDCSSSRPNSHGKSIDIGGKIALFSWVKEMGMISSDGVKKIENGEKNSRCSCCDVSLNTEFYSPYFLFKPSWGVLDYTQKGNLITEVLGEDTNGGESSDPCKSDCPTDHFDDDEYEIKRNREEQEEENGVSEDNQILSDLDEVNQRRDEDEEEEKEKDCLRSPSSFRCNETVIVEDDIQGTVRRTEKEPIEEEEDSNIPVEGKDVLLQSPEAAMIQLCCKEDESIEIISLGLENFSDFYDHRLVPVQYIDFMTLENQRLSGFREVEHGEDGNFDSGAQKQNQTEGIVVKESALEGETEVSSADDSKESSKFENIESWDLGEDDNSSVSPAEKHHRNSVIEVSDQVPIAEATPTLSFNGDDVEAVAVALMESDKSLALEEEESLLVLCDETHSESIIGRVMMPDHESTNHTRDHEPSSSFTCPQADQSSSYNNDVENCINSNAFITESDLGSKQVDEVAIEGGNMLIERIAQGINHHLSICSELNEVEEEDKAPGTPTYVEGLHHLNKKLLPYEKKELGAEESLDGSVVSEIESGEGLLTIENLKTALKAERKALNALYTELEEERSASSIAANQTMAMITRLQEEKAAMQMEALQYQRMMEEQCEYDQEALQLLNELMVKREKEKQELEKELEIYRKKVLHYEAKEKKMMRRKTNSERSRSASTSSSNVDSDEQSIDLNHEGADEDSFYGNHNTPADAVLNLEDIVLESAKHLSTLDESLADFEEERNSILEQLKALEEKLFTLGVDDDDHDEKFEDIKPVEHLSEENSKDFHENYEFSSQDINGVVNGFSDELGGKHYQERRNMSAKAKRLLPLFDSVDIVNEDDQLSNGHGGSNSVASQNSSISKFTPDDKKLAIEEEVDHVYERLQALEADREFLKHCISSLKKGDKGMDLLQEILQHLRDLRSVELRVRSIGDAALP